MADSKIVDVVAQYLVDQGIRHVFGIIGSVNAHLFDAIYHHPQLHLVCFTMNKHV